MKLQTPPQLLNRDEIMALVWPNEETRPSVRWFDGLLAKRLIRVRRIGGLNFFVASEVAEDLEKLTCRGSRPGVRGPKKQKAAATVTA